MSNRFLVQSVAFLVLSLASAWVYFNNFTFKEAAKQDIRSFAAGFHVDMNSPSAIKEAVTKAEDKIQEVDQRIEDLKGEIETLDEQKGLLDKFIRTFAHAGTNRKPDNAQFNDLPEESQDLIREVESQSGRSLVDFKRDKDAVKASYDGEVLVQTGRSGQPIIPDNAAEAFYQVNAALGGVSQLRNVVISAEQGFGPQRTRLKKFIKDYLGGQGIKNLVITEKQSNDGIKVSLDFKGSIE